MSVNLNQSKTMANLMRAFAGESQARNRYTIAASQAKMKKLYVIESVLKFTADQEKEHAEIFYQHLTELAGKSIQIDGGYPVDISQDVAQLLRYAQHNEYEEHDDVYRHFAQTASEEGFEPIAASFRMIGEIEKTHGDRLGIYAKLLEENKLFVSDVEIDWMCLKCGNIYHGKEVPQTCPVCHHEQGYFIRLELAPWSSLAIVQNDAGQIK